MDVALRTRLERGQQLPVVVVRFPDPMRVAASAPHGGGLGPRRWVINAQAGQSARRRDPDRHLGKLAVSLGLSGRGVGMLTPAEVGDRPVAAEDGVEVLASAHLDRPLPTAAAAEGEPMVMARGTINVLAVVPAPLSDAALVNAVATVTEAKAQALRDLGTSGTGTPTDAVTIACPHGRRQQAFGGPRSFWGSRLARAVHTTLLEGGGEDAGEAPPRLSDRDRIAALAEGSDPDEVSP